jgi:hypothetical protein
MRLVGVIRSSRPSELPLLAKKIQTWVDRRLYLASDVELAHAKSVSLYGPEDPKTKVLALILPKAPKGTRATEHVGGRDRRH